MHLFYDFLHKSQEQNQLELNHSVDRRNAVNAMIWLTQDYTDPFWIWTWRIHA